MKLDDFSLIGEQEELHSLRESIDSFNRTEREYPRDSTIHAEFRRIVETTPGAAAIIEDGRIYTYSELERRSNRLARLLVHLGLAPEGIVAVLHSSTWLAAVSMLGVLKAGGAYLPLDADAPRARTGHTLQEANATVLISEKKYTRLINQLQWDCPALQSVLCLDSINFHSEPETGGDFMDRGIWDLVGDEAFDDISGGGWKSSYTGEWLSREVMDEYASNVLAKLSPFIAADTRILEIGCSSGITLFQLAPLAGRYFGTDLSPKILEFTRREIERRQLRNVALAPLAAHETMLCPEDSFDLVVMNSVAQCFRGHNYLRDVLRQAIAKMAERGVLFLGDLSDQDLKPQFIESLETFKRANAGKGYRTQVDRSEELFLSRVFLEDLQHDFPEIHRVEFSYSLATAASEMKEFGYDAILYIDKTPTCNAAHPRRKCQLDSRAIEDMSDSPLDERSGPDNLAYVIYTSGTTGWPNGSMIEHRSVLRLAKNSGVVPLNDDTCMLRTGALSFDASTLEFWGTLLNGGRLCGAPPKSILDTCVLKRLIRENGVNTMWLTAGLLNQLADADLDVFKGLRYVLTGGEKLSPHHINKVKRAWPELALINGYGPTENTTFTTSHRIEALYEQDIPIGSPVGNTQVYIMDGMEPAAIGVPGELCAGGDGLARGYLNNPSLTALKFQPHPFEPGQRLYRTGDLARWLYDGTVEFLGRLDNQVKVRGFRIELEEIEACLSRYPGIKQVVVVAWDKGGESKELATYYTAEEVIGAEVLREHLRTRLPDYMIPVGFTRVARMPLTPNGKADRRALPRPESIVRTQRTPPANETEAALVNIWQRVLEQPDVGVTDNFFELGGHSLKVVKMASLIAQELGVDVPLMVIFEKPVVRALAEFLITSSRFGVAELDEPLVLMNQGAAGNAIFAFPPGKGDALGYTGLARALPEYDFFGFNFIPEANRMERYADLICSAQPAGACVLFGYSGGGRLAYHTATELERRGRTVSDIVMLDSSRYLAKLPIGRKDLDETVRQFIEADDVKPYLGTGALRDKATQTIRCYYEYLYNSIDDIVVNANIHVVQCENARSEYRASDGTLIASYRGWQQATRGRFSLHQGFGDHSSMLNEPNFEKNLDIVKQILAHCRSSRSSVVGGAE